MNETTFSKPKRIAMRQEIKKTLTKIYTIEENEDQENEDQENEDIGSIDDSQKLNPIRDYIHTCDCF